jgi:hypothetical protein
MAMTDTFAARVIMRAIPSRYMIVVAISTLHCPLVMDNPTIISGSTACKMVSNAI